MGMRDQDKEIEMPNTLGYNLPKRDSSSSTPTLAATVGERSHQSPQTHTLIFSDPPQTSHHHHLYPPSPPLPSNQRQQSRRPRRDPDPSSSPIATTSITSTLIVSGSNPSRTATPAGPPPQQTTGTALISTPLIRYRECLKNHAASMGGHVTDGCGEFMPTGEEGTPESLKCAACECHRNFHRKDAEGEPQHVPNYYIYDPNKSNGQNRISSSHLPTHVQFPIPSSSLHQHHRFSHGVIATPSPGLIPPLMMALGGGGGPAESSSEDLNVFQSNAGGQLSVQPTQSKNKRFRTKFTQQQKESMMEFAEKLGWKIQKHDEQEVHQFCSQVGVKRQVFKVWMHNNKQAMKKKQL